jgi:NADH:ubiquinone oxidoreductase subunit 5 (subunit L)/multisubunit Na+/H+ antiporter MnhA subunit
MVTRTLPDIGSFCCFFIGSCFIVLSDNLLMVFFGWEGVGLASLHLIGFRYQDKKKDFAGNSGPAMRRNTVVGYPHPCWDKGIANDQGR